MPAPASVPGRLKIALISGWLWLNGEYVSPLAQIDYRALFVRLQDRRAAAGDGVEAKTFELEVDAAADWRNVQDVLGLVEDADYERVELIAGSGRFSLHTGRSSSVTRSSGGGRTVVVLRRDVSVAWSGNDVAADAAAGSRSQLERLFEVRRSGSEGQLEAALARVCSEGRCARVVLYFEADVPGSELLRALESLARAARTAHAGATLPVISLSPSAPPAPGEEARAFVLPSKGWGRLPPLVIRQIVRAHYHVFRGCYERGLATNPKLEGRVTVRFAILEDGSVGQVSNVGSDLPSEEVIKCVLQGFGGLRFPAPKDGIVTVQYPIMLQPG